jgi:hypothetical protein
LQAGNCFGQRNDSRIFVFLTVLLEHFQAGVPTPDLTLL